MGPNSSATTLTVASTSGFKTSGIIDIGTETILYSGISSNNFTGCTRGISGTVAIEHSVGDTVMQRLQKIYATPSFKNTYDNGFVINTSSLAVYIKS